MSRMLAALSALLIAHPALPTLADVEAKIAAWPGAEIQSEMVSPSNVPTTFRISKSGAQWERYPTSERFVGLKSVVTWMPDRREYATEAIESPNPVPVGFHTLWPVDSHPYKQLGETAMAQFEGAERCELVLRGTAPYDIHLFVDANDWTPIGTRVLFNGTTYVMRYKQAKPKAFSLAELTFSPPKDARPATPTDPSLKLIKPGAKLSSINAKDLTGKAFNLKSAMATYPKGLVLNFWFSSCTGCVAEMPYLVWAHPKLAASKVGLIGVNSVDAADSARKTSKLNKLGYPTLTGPGADKLTRAVSVLAYPVTIVLRPDATVVDAIMGFDEKRFRSAVRQLGVDLAPKP